jgi:hypothetical protein
VRVEAVDHEDPFGAGVGVHGPGDVRDELRFGTGRLQCWADDHSRHHVQTGGQRRRPVPGVFEFRLRYAVGLGRLVGGVPLDGLQRGRLVHAHRVRAIGHRLRRRLKIGSANIVDLGLEFLGILLCCVEPHFLAVRLNGCLLQKAADL